MKDWEWKKERRFRGQNIHASCSVQKGRRFKGQKTRKWKERLENDEELGDKPSGFE